jgi:colanic acid/amylovoran biosynthesis glycosyltransferase
VTGVAIGSQSDQGPARAPATTDPPFRLTYVVGTYPVLTTTFIDREIAVLREMGVDVRIVSIRRPRGVLSPEQEALASRVHYVIPVPIGTLVSDHVRLLGSQPGKYLGALLHLLSRPHPTIRTRLRTILHFGLAVHVARILRDRYPTDHIHAHFVDRASLVALVIGKLLDIPFSATAHANDIFVDPVLLPEKVAAAKFIATCSRYNADYLRSLSANGDARKITCIYHGLDVGRFPHRPIPTRVRPLILAVGQLKAKKGFPYLIEACRILRAEGLEFECHIIGEGPLRAELEEKVRSQDLADRVALLGALPHQAVVEKYRDATVFVLPCVTGTDGDRDGIPNVILEAMAMGVPVVSTRHSGIPEAIEDGISGLLVPPKDAWALAYALRRLIHDEPLRERLGRNSRKKIVEMFDVRRNVEVLLERFVS